MKGTVKWWDDKKGFGFIIAEGGKEIFVHHTAIKAEGHRQLVDGEAVEFEVVDTEKGARAANVVRLNPQPATR